MDPILLNAGLSVIEALVANEPAIAAQLHTLFSGPNPPTLDQLRAFRARVVLKKYSDYDSKPLPAPTNLVALPAAPAAPSQVAESPSAPTATNPPPPVSDSPVTPPPVATQASSLPAGPSAPVAAPPVGAGAPAAAPSATAPAPATAQPTDDSGTH